MPRVQHEFSQLSCERSGNFIVRQANSDRRLPSRYIKASRRTVCCLHWIIQLAVCFLQLLRPDLNVIDARKGNFSLGSG